MRQLAVSVVSLLAAASCHKSPRTAATATPGTQGSAPAPAAATAAAPPASTLEVGSMAPDFALPGSDGQVHHLSDDRGKRVVILAWFPKAFTGG